MNSFDSYLVFVLFVVFSLVSRGRGWAFTEVDYDRLLKIQSEVFGEDDYPLNEDEIQQLKVNLVYPGTKWCGPGSTADNFNDLGSEWKTDTCCRDHDNCPDLLVAGETKFNLTNEAFYTRLSCKCDETFRACLHSANRGIANRIGTIYFNAIGTKCYRKDFPVTGCNKRGGWFYRKCLNYTFDRNSKKRFQWFDVPNY